MCPPTGSSVPSSVHLPLSLCDLWSTVRTVKRTSWFYFATPRCIPGATGALRQVLPYMDAETPGQASRKGSAPLRADVVLSVRRITENGNGERFERRDRERRTWRKKRKFSLHEIYLSCHIIKKTMIMIRLMDDCPMKSNFSMNTNENLSVMTHFN